MELTQLKQFKAVAEKNSISLAAKELHVSQPALSTAIKKLEDEFELPLFEHSGNKIRLNEAGELALQYANTILLQSGQMKAALREYAHKNFRIRLGFCDPGPMWYCVPRLSMISEQLEHDCYTMPVREDAILRNGKYDIIISSDKLEAPDIISFVPHSYRFILPFSSGMIAFQLTTLPACYTPHQVSPPDKLADDRRLFHLPFWITFSHRRAIGGISIYPCALAYANAFQDAL